MADVTGPISSLPGAYHAMKPGTKCDDHPDRDAVARVQGETDSFGCELIDMCQECLDEYRVEMKKDHEGFCEWCKTQASHVSPRRDYEEGLSGRVYMVCRPCVEKETKRLKEESEQYEQYYYEDSYWDEEV